MYSFSHNVLCERFFIEPLIGRGRMFHILFLFTTIHDPYNCPSILEMLHFDIPRANKCTFTCFCTNVFADVDFTIILILSLFFEKFYSSIEIYNNNVLARDN